MIDKDKLLRQLELLEQWNNSDVPIWVINVIKGIPEEPEKDNELKNPELK